MGPELSASTYTLVRATQGYIRVFVGFRDDDGVAA